MTVRRAIAAAAIAACLTLSCASAQEAGQKPRLTLMSSFEPERLAPLMAQMQTEAGMEIKLESADDDLILGRLAGGTPIDLVLMANYARLELAAAAGLLAKITPPGAERLPAVLRETEGRWAPIATVARPILYAQGKVKQTEVTSYGDLAAPAWRGRLCAPQPNQAGLLLLLASMTHRRGPEAAQHWAAGVHANAVTPKLTPPANPEAVGVLSEDIRLVEALASGACDVAIVSSRAIARLGDRPRDADRAMLEKVGVIWPKADQGGASIGIIGAALPASGQRAEAATKLVGWLLSDTGQRLFAEAVYAYPARPGVPLSNPLTRWGPFEADRTPLTEISTQIDAAREISDKVGWP
ncbi:MAG: extracellular solute-binding protein [Elsteraceae bacterium]